tara:strand:- start:22081 stop:22404 length:324 start_codon:yes stop_codon:yes gene_type:complete
VIINLGVNCRVGRSVEEQHKQTGDQQCQEAELQAASVDGTTRHMEGLLSLFERIACYKHRAFLAQCKVCLRLQMRNGSQLPADIAAKVKEFRHPCKEDLNATQPRFR